MDNNKNIFSYEEKPYYTNEERLQYLRIAIEEAQKIGDKDLENHYQLLLMLEEKNNEIIGDSVFSNKKTK